MRRFKNYDVVRLKKRVSVDNVTEETTGTVLFVYETVPPAYEVEFLDEQGNSLAVVSLTEDQLEESPPKQ